MLKLLLSLLLFTLLFTSSNTSFTQSSLVVAQSQSTGNPNVRVWVNTNSGVYHCPGTRWYGNTKDGKYMTQKEAQANGYRPAYGIACG